MKDRTEATGDRTAIYNGTLLTMDASYHQYDQGLLITEDSLIIYVGPFRQELLSGIAPEHRIDAQGGLIIPGLINTHTHLGMSLFRSLADDTADRLRKVLIPMEKALVNPQLVYYASLHSISEMLLGGTTTCADMYFFADQSARALQESGMRAVVGSSLSSAAGPDAAEFSEGLERLRELMQTCEHSDLTTAAAAPHAPYSLKREDLLKVSRFAADHRLPVLSHLAEMPFEEPYTLEHYQMRPIPFYDSCGLIDDRAVMAHCIFASEEDRKLLISRDCGIAHNVSANSKSAKGIAPAYAFYRAGARIGLGTDGPMSGNTLDLVHLLGMTAKLQKLKEHDATVMHAREVVSMATIGGARALHMEDRIGSLEVGKKADITVFSVDSPAMFPIYDPYSALVYSASPSDVSLVMIDGRIVSSQRRLHTIDTTALREACRTFTGQIAAKMR